MPLLKISNRVTSVKIRCLFVACGKNPCNSDWNILDINCTYSSDAVTLDTFTTFVWYLCFTIFCHNKFQTTSNI